MIYAVRLAQLLELYRCQGCQYFVQFLCVIVACLVDTVTEIVQVVEGLVDEGINCRHQLRHGILLLRCRLVEGVMEYHHAQCAV